jgi:dipeptide transport system ATP-binding protein
MALLEIENLSVDFPSHADNVMHAVDGVSLSLDTGDVLGIVGESGSGKSVTMMALMGLVAYPGRVKADKLRFDGHDLLALSRARARRLTGKDLSMIFQDPTTSLNPCFTWASSWLKRCKLHLHMDKRPRANGAPSNCWSRSAFPHPRAVWRVTRTNSRAA